MYEVIFKKSYIMMRFEFNLIADAVDFIQTALDNYKGGEEKEKLSVCVRRAEEEESEEE